MPIGATYDPLGEHLQDPYPFYERARAETPVFYSPLLESWVVTRHDDLTTVLRDPETYSSARALPVVLPVAEEALAVVAKGRPQLPDVVQSDGEAHARMRAPLAAALRPDRVAAMEPALRERAVALAAAVREGGGRAELMTAYAIPLTQAAIGLLCGFDEELAVRTYSLMDSLVRLGSQRQTEPEQMASAEAGAELAAVVARLLRERRAAPGDDAFSLVAASMAEGDRPLTPLEEAEAVGNLMQLVIAGQVTTAPLLGGAVALLLGERGGEEWRRIAADRSLVPAAVEELVRLVAPASGLYRETTRPVTLGGVDLPEGARLVLRYNAACRDPAKYDRPHELDLGRSPNRHLAFGRGPHYCVGAPLARLQLTITLEVLPDALPGLRLAAPVALRPTLDVRHPEAVHVAW
ncbi:hypothetical protein HNP84_001179 [Thermocatellispora tengchongensis]|uniref:Cytochrome P450 n=1 Tax=Thermocatellispora tengchongensis TaxID=1073253 RepID=A0A840P0L3_9ACTN|nr:cytochrome P450 [Thermocatellispora tengchongensis]MBB5131473.1 hypothetical protein [Thermocatellispora tengchongensis]